ncbi:MAG: sigma-70 family RNA polymerase sigma factor [Planctomycetota bacterium]|nr:sigma-70 family RNA polymerase sigma factor [Planctomycetota bacterium]
MFDPILSELVPTRAPAPVRRGRARKVSARLTRQARDKAIALLARSTPFVDSPEFRKRGAEKRLFDDAPDIQAADVSWYRPLVEDLSAHTTRDARFRQTKPLTGREEVTLFRQMNYSRYRMERLHRQLRGKEPTTAVLVEALHWRDRAVQLRFQIAESNVALVLAMARRVRADDMEFADLIGEGNMALMRSVDKFDCERGFKFSTYACRAILKAFSRAGINSTKYRQRYSLAYDPELEIGNAVDPRAGSAVTDGSTIVELRELLSTNAAALSPVEHSVIENRFGFTAHLNDDSPTLEEVGRRLGLTKERVRQVQNHALAKLRSLLGSREESSAAGGSCN